MSRATDGQGTARCATPFDSGPTTRGGRRSWRLLLATALCGLAAANPAAAQGVAQSESQPAPAHEGDDTEASREFMARPGHLSAVFAYGNSAGEPSGGKWITLASLYTLSAASLAFATVEFAEHLQNRRAAEDFLRQSAAEGPCFDLASARCERYSDLVGARQRSATLAAASLAASGVLLLSGVITAQVWDNEPPSDADHAVLRPQVYGSLDSAYVGLSGSF
jgi:hypothetical protein